MKFAEEIFPFGTFKGQKSAGAYINETLAENLDVMVDMIDKDMTFLGLITGNDSVGNGKTTFVTQIGCYLTYKINQKYGLNNEFTANNIVMEGKDLPNKSFSMPKFSVIQLDEGDDMTTHSMKQISVNLKRYFRKCRQLNQILLIILPSFFELPKFYALNRSHFLINVKFQNKFERGYFEFYSPKGKKNLYIHGKKNWDYDAWKPDFPGNFFSSYCFFPDLKKNIETYKQMKLRDMQDDHLNKYTKKPEDVEREVRIALFKKLHDSIPIKSYLKLCEIFEISVKTGRRWVEPEQKQEKGTEPEDTYNINITQDDEVIDEGRLL
jgi:hypothetical protein